MEVSWTCCDSRITRRRATVGKVPSVLALICVAFPGRHGSERALPCRALQLPQKRLSRLTVALLGVIPSFAAYMSRLGPYADEMGLLADEDSKCVPGCRGAGPGCACWGHKPPASFHAGLG